MFVVRPKNLPSRLRLPFHRSESSRCTDPSPVSFTLVHVIPRQGHAVQLPRELRLKNHQTAVAECQLARGEVKFPHAAKPLIGKATFLSVTLYEALTPTTKRFRIVRRRISKSVIIRPPRSMTGATSERAGMCPPGKMYFRVHALVIAGPLMRPIEWMRAMPSALNRFRIFWKNVA